MATSLYTDAEYKKLEFSSWKIFCFGWYLIKNNFKQLAIITLLMAIPTNIIAELIIANNILPIREGINGIKDTGHIFKISGILFMSVAFIGCLQIIQSFLQGGEKNIKEVLISSIKIWPYLIGTGILYSLAILGGMILVIIPGIIVAVWFGFSMYFVALEKVYFVNALKESKKLVVGRWWKTLGMGALFGIITLVILGIPTLIVMGILGAVMPSDSMIVSILSDTLGDIISIPSTYVGVAFFLAFQKFPPQIENKTI